MVRGVSVYWVLFLCASVLSSCTKSSETGRPSRDNPPVDTNDDEGDDGDEGTDTGDDGATLDDEDSSYEESDQENIDDPAGDMESASDEEGESDVDSDSDEEGDAAGDSDSDSDSDTETDDESEVDSDDDGSSESSDDEETSEDTSSEEESETEETDTQHNTDEEDEDTEDDGDGGVDDDTGSDTKPKRPMEPELWYISGNTLVYIPIDEATGLALDYVASEVSGLLLGFNSITMLEDGSLVGARLQITGEDLTTQLYYIPDPPRDGSPVSVVEIGIMPDGIGIEALYTDCDGRLYAIDTGADVGSMEGNRLIRFEGDYLAGDFEFVQISDLSVEDVDRVRDVDDMGPGIDTDGTITDNPGFAIDSQRVYEFNYETGIGREIGQGGDWGVHALGGPLFTDGTSRLYLLSQSAELFLVLDLDAFSLSDPLMEGPPVEGTQPAHSGMTGPLTDCETGFVIVV